MPRAPCWWSASENTNLSKAKRRIPRPAEPGKKQLVFANVRKALTGRMEESEP